MISDFHIAKEVILLLFILTNLADPNIPKQLIKIILLSLLLNAQHGIQIKFLRFHIVIGAIGVM
jgi:hypothetical protein